MIKVWYKIADPTVIISTGKSVGNPDEDFIKSDVVPEDDEFYEIQAGAVVRKAQAAIDAIVALRAQAMADLAEAEQQKIADIITNLPSWAQVKAEIDNISDLDGAKTFLLKLSRVVYWLAKDSEE